MTPKEKAEDLKTKLLPYVDWMNIQSDETDRKWAIRNAKKCALITVDEILSMKIVRKDDLTDEYWEEVKREIELL